MSTDDKHEGAERALDQIQDAAGAVVGKVSAALSGKSGIAFVRNAALADHYTIEAGEIARVRARSRPVMALADKLVANHMASRQLLFAALGRSQFNEEEKLPPAELDARRQSMIDHLNKTPEAEFDKTYLQQQLAAHDEARTLFEAYADEGADPHLRAHALSVLPGVNVHARTIAAIQMTVANGASN